MREEFIRSGNKEDAIEVGLGVADISGLLTPISSSINDEHPGRSLYQDNLKYSLFTYNDVVSHYKKKNKSRTQVYFAKLLESDDIMETLSAPKALSNMDDIEYMLSLHFWLMTSHNRQDVLVTCLNNISYWLREK